MSSVNFAKSSLSHDPLLFFSNQLNVSIEEIQEMILNIFPIEKEDIGDGEMSVTDTHLIELCLHMMLCYQKCLPPLAELEGQKENVVKCMKHPKKKLNFVCTNVECPLRFHCMTCRKDHGKKCSRSQMLITPQVFEDDLFHEEYHEVNEGEIENHLSKVENLGIQMKEIFNRNVDVMVKHWKNEILTMSKEPMLKYARSRLLEKHRAFKGRAAKSANVRREDPEEPAEPVLGIPKVHVAEGNQGNDFAERQVQPGIRAGEVYFGEAGEDPQRIQRAKPEQDYEGNAPDQAKLGRGL